MGKRNYDDGRPKGLTTSYAFFIKKMSEQNSGDNKLRFSEFAKQCSQIWKGMTDEEKQPYNDMAEHDKARYEQELAVFKQNGGTLAKPGSKKARAEKKDPNKPKTPRTAFFLFSAEMRDLVKQQNPAFKVTDVARELGRLWREIDEVTKAKFQEASEAERKVYHEKMAVYKAEKAEEEREAREAAAAAAAQEQQYQHYYDNQGGSDDEDDVDQGGLQPQHAQQHQVQHHQVHHHQQYQQVQVQPQYVTSQQAAAIQQQQAQPVQATHYVKQYVQEVHNLQQRPTTTTTTTYYQTAAGQPARIVQAAAAPSATSQQQQQQQQPSTSNNQGGGYVYVSEGKQFYQQ